MFWYVRILERALQPLNGWSPRELKKQSMNYKEACGEGNDHRFCPWCGQSKKEHWKDWKGGIMEKLLCFVFFCLYFYYWSIPESWRRYIITLGAFSALISDFNFIPQSISNYQTCKASSFLFLPFPLPPGSQATSLELLVPGTDLMLHHRY